MWTSDLSADLTLIVTSVAIHPVLLAVDEFQALYGKTAYCDPHFVPIHSYHLGATFDHGVRLRKKGIRTFSSRFPIFLNP